MLKSYFVIGLLLFTAIFAVSSLMTIIITIKSLVVGCLVVALCALCVMGLHAAATDWK